MIKKVLTYSDTIHTLHGGAEGLWIGHNGGVTCFEPKRGTAVKWNTGDGLPALPVVHVVADAERVVVATPNGIAWSDDARALVRDGAADVRRLRWEHGLAHPDGTGAFVHGVAFVQGRVYAASGGGRLYRKSDAGFERIELPLPQARLTRIVPLAASGGRLRVLVLTNNSGVLLLATGGHEEPSVYQWSEDEGLQSRYTTAIGIAGGHAIVAVRGGVHAAPIDKLVDTPETWSRWGRIRIDEPAPAVEGSRIAAVCAHGEFLWIGTALGLHRLPLDELQNAARDAATAVRIDDTPVRHLESSGDTLWIVQGNTLGRWSTASAESPPAEAHGSLRSRLFRVRAPRVADTPPPPQHRPAAADHFVSESRWRVAGTEPECRRSLALAASPEGLAVGGEAGRVAVLHGDRWTTESLARLRRPPEVHALAWDAENASFWAATRFGLYQRDARGRWHRDHLFPGRTVHALLPWGGSMAACGTAGLHVFVQGEWVEVPFAGDAPPLAVGTANEDALAVWGRTGLFVWRAGSARPEAVSADVGRAICLTWGDAGELWVGSDRGLARWDGERVTRYGWGDERRDRVTALLVHRGELIVGSQAGVFIAPLRGVREARGPEALEASGQRLGLLDGLPDAQIAAAVVHDSRAWIGTPSGLVMLA